MESKRRPRRHFDDQFRLSVLKEFYSGDMSLNSICRKYSISLSNFHCWEKKYMEETVPLPLEITELERQVYMSRSLKKAQLCKDTSSPKTREEELSEEISRLRKALEYSELRNEALSEVLKIGRERYGIDLLKKAGAKQ